MWKYAQNELIKLNDTSLRDTTLIIKNHEITDTYTFQYEHCFRDICSPMRRSISAQSISARAETLLILDYDLVLDDVYFKRNIRNENHFFTHFVTVRYVRNGETRVADITNRTPIEVNDRFIMQVDRNIIFAEAIELLITIRNKQYAIKLK